MHTLRTRRQTASAPALLGHDRLGLRVRIAWQPRRSWRAVPLLERVARYVAAAEGFGRGDLSVVVLGRAAMAELHERSMNVTGPTDVLTFDLGTHRRRGVLTGEIYICADVARATSRRQVARAGAGRPGRAAAQPLAAARAELALYLVHGILHLAGYDDRTAGQFHEMHAREDALLRAVGLGAVFRNGEMSR